MLANSRIRDYAKKCGVKQWEIAEAYGLSEGNFSRKLRRELPETEQQQIMQLIDEIHNGRR